MIEQTKPILYCDVDGVINLAAKTTHEVMKKTVFIRPPAMYRQGTLKRAVPFKVRWRETMVASLCSLPVSFWWLTTWNDQAVRLLEPLTGIRSEGVINYHIRFREIGKQTSKYTLLRAHQAENPQPFIWIDDVATQYYNEAHWDGHPTHLVIRPQKRHGITDDHLAQMKEFIANTTPKR